MVISPIDFPCCGFRCLGKPSSSLKVTFINGADKKSFSKKSKISFTYFYPRRNRVKYMFYL
ncbi:hypothetical protein C1141_16670 [Vibrio agarivorans]|nr:hypothetical protein C1141_16670 [Vibrio agarivorans]